MYSSSSNVKSNIYHLFQEIDRSAYRNVIQFYEYHSGLIAHLSEAESLELNVVYLRSLFEISSYQNFLSNVDEVIEWVIINNVILFEGEDIYYEMLLKKASALYHVRRFDEAVSIASQLMKIDPENRSAAFLLRKIYLNNKPDYLKNAQGASIILFLTTSLLCAVELYMISYDFNAFQPTVEIFRIGSFICGFLILGLSQLYHYVKNQLVIERMIKFD